MEWSNLPLDRVRQGWSIYVHFWKGMGRWATNGKVGPKCGICPLKRGPPQNKKKTCNFARCPHDCFFFLLLIVTISIHWIVDMIPISPLNPWIKYVSEYGVIPDKKILILRHGGERAQPHSKPSPMVGTYI